MIEGSAGKRVGPMPPWEQARPVFSWWGVILDEPWRLAVVDPRLDQAAANQRSDAVEEWHFRPALQRAYITGAVVVLLIIGALVAVAFWLRSIGAIGIAALICFVAAFLVPALRGLLRWIPPELPADVRLRPGVGGMFWGLVRHLNSYRSVDADTTAAVRGLLWALAHTDERPEHRALIAELAGKFQGWSEHGPAELREAAARVWAQIPEG
ncbi:hypothetical protein [Amycolatopsis anabasis]|uniref:hypothetical protein n=1 Tax=Amycolatopsis anabasis TaxID=1840409 RepID=UPI00131AE3C6|nr:hypothetical protein [Amycolatopsis anabasis]